MCSAKGNLIWAISNCFLFSPLIAFPALLFSILQFTKGKEHYISVTTILNITTCIIGIILWIILIIIYFSVFAYISSGLSHNFYKSY